MLLLVTDNAPAHSLPDDYLLCQHPGGVLDPPNIAPVLKPTDEGVIATFRGYYHMKNFQTVKATRGQNGATLRQFWKDNDIYKAVKDASCCEIAAYNTKSV